MCKFRYLYTGILDINFRLSNSYKLPRNTFRIMTRSQFNIGKNFECYPLQTLNFTDKMFCMKV